MNESTTKEQELLAKLITQDAYSWQEFYRNHQNEDYGDAIQKIYIYLATDNSKRITVDELEACINRIPGRFLKDPPDGDSFTSTNPSDWNYMPTSYGD